MPLDSFLTSKFSLHAGMRAAFGVAVIEARFPGALPDGVFTPLGSAWLAAQNTGYTEVFT